MSVQDHVLEREHNKTLEKHLIFNLMSQDLAEGYPQEFKKMDFEVAREDFTMARRANEIKIYQDYP